MRSAAGAWRRLRRPAAYQTKKGRQSSQYLLDHTNFPRPMQVAAALLARLRLAPQHMEAALKGMAAFNTAKHTERLKQLLALQQQLPPEAQHQLAAQMGLPGDDLEAGMALCQAAIDSGDVDAMEQVTGLYRAVQNRRELLALGQSKPSGDSDPSIPPYMEVGRCPLTADNVLGPTACPEAALLAFLADLADTHPPYHARLARIRLLSSQLPMQLRAASPPVPVGGRHSHLSVAEQVALRLEAGMRAEAAAREVAKQAAEEPAAAGLSFGGSRGAAAGAVVVGIAAAAALLAAADL